MKTKHRTVTALSEKIGHPPGSLIYVGKSKSLVETTLEWFKYDQNSAEYEEKSRLERLPLDSQSSQTTWINVTGLKHIDTIQSIGNSLGIHRLHLEDVLNTLHRPKLDDHANYLFVTLKMGQTNSKGKVVFENISLFLFKNLVLTFQEKEGDVFDDIRLRIKEGSGQIRKKKADYLFCQLFDAIIDHYFLVTEKVVVRAQQFEDDIFQSPNESLLIEAKRLKKDMFYIRRSVTPIRDILNKLLKRESDLLDVSNLKYFSDVLDSTLHVLDSISLTLEILSNVLDIYVSSLSIKMNLIMGRLTLVATIFIPLTFLVGIYGMNFKFMPELELRWGYPVLLTVMGVMVVWMLAYFKKKDWL